jgi:hypothetical protein
MTRNHSSRGKESRLTQLIKAVFEAENNVVNSQHVYSKSGRVHHSIHKVILW